ncbi:unnamed protein product [Rotaria sp. Silwood1]|nr:unnamed protein product [Rotaria sp. Silwood1]
MLYFRKFDFLSDIQTLLNPSPLTTTTTTTTANTTARSIPQRSDSSSDTQITSFLSHLGNETYRRNIREKLNERRIHKQAEIRVREEEIKVIEDIIQFINEFELKRFKNLSPKPINSSLPVSLTTTTTNNDSISQLNQQDSINEDDRLETINNSTLLNCSSLPNTINDLSHRYSSIKSRHNSSIDNQNIRLSKDEITFDTLTNSLFSPQQGTYCLSSPMTPFSILSLSSPLTPIPLSISPTSTQITTIESSQSIPPSTNNITTINNCNNIILSSSSIDPITTTTTTDQNPNIISTEKPSIKSSFNRSLPHSLVS